MSKYWSSILVGLLLLSATTLPATAAPRNAMAGTWRAENGMIHHIPDTFENFNDNAVNSKEQARRFRCQWIQAGKKFKLFYGRSDDIHKSIVTYSDHQRLLEVNADGRHIWWRRMH